MIGNEGHSNWSEMMFLLLLMLAMPIILEAGMIAVFLLSAFKWRLWWLSVLMGIGMVIVPVWAIKFWR